MENRRKIIIAVIIILVLLASGVGFWWWLGLGQKTVGPSAGLTNEPTDFRQQIPVSSAITNTNALAPLVKEVALESTLKSVARTFAERLGSYSNQGNFSNLEDLRSLMTVKMSGWADNYIAEQKAANASAGVYYGVTTLALAVNITAFDESLGRAEARVSTQRQEAKESTVNPRTFYQDLLLKLVKTAEGWKVDEAVWQ